MRPLKMPFISSTGPGRYCATDATKYCGKKKTTPVLLDESVLEVADAELVCRDVSDQTERADALRNCLKTLIENARWDDHGIQSCRKRASGVFRLSHSTICRELPPPRSMDPMCCSSISARLRSRRKREYPLEGAGR